MNRKNSSGTMFKLSVISDEVSQDLERIISFAKKFNLDGIEIRTLWNKKPHELVNYASRIRKMLNESGLAVSAIASPFFKADIDRKDEYTQHIDILKKCIELAKSLDTDIVRGFTFWRKAPLDEYLEIIVEKFSKPLDIVENEGIILAIENEYSTFVNNARRLSQFLKAIESKNVKALWDPGNDIFDPEGEIPYPDGYNMIKDNIVHIHVKDGVRKGKSGKPETRPVGEGEVNYREQIRALIRDRYKGYLSLETHWRPVGELPEELLLKPGGAGFSAMGEYASEICMQKLINIINSVRED